MRAKVGISKAVFFGKVKDGGGDGDKVGVL